ncbi:MAG: hypothetical protein ACRD2B_08600 [Terriglobia bacterium]
MQSQSRHSYALNNPTTLTDPLGLEANACTIDGQPGYCTTTTQSGGNTIEIINVASYGAAEHAPTSPAVVHNPLVPPIKLVTWPQLQILAQPGQAPNNGTVKCSGSARVLQGNSATIGHPGGFSGPSVGNFPVTANGAAVIPSQWGPSKAFLRPFLNQTSGVFPNVNYSFTGIVDVMGGAPPPGFPPGSNVQTDLMQLNPGKLILELPGSSQDFGTTAVTIATPSAVGCPAGTVQVPQ